MTSSYNCQRIGVLLILLAWMTLDGNCRDSLNHCIGSLCQNGGVCVDSITGYVCQCPRGFTGTFCELDIDECALVLRNGESGGICQNGGDCHNTRGSYDCICTHGWTGTNCSIPVDNCRDRPCHHQGQCANLPNGHYKCTCPSGFLGMRCELQDLCLNSSTCPPNSRCTMSIVKGKANCDCLQGFYGPNCDDINECSEFPCNPDRGSCVNLPGSFRCHCKPGFIGARCDTDVNECSSNPCQNGGVCLDKHGYYQCSCPAGYDGANCEHQKNECASSPCGLNRSCEDLVDGFRCHCRSGWGGELCDRPWLPCDSNPCQNNGLCTNGAPASAAAYNCSCRGGFRGRRCEVVDPGKPSTVAVSHPCMAKQTTRLCQNGGTCIPLPERKYACICTTGYKGRHCEDAVPPVQLDNNPCTRGQPCGDHGICTDQGCKCRPPWSGANCTELNNPASPDTCKSSPCANEAPCLPSEQGTNYTCRCDYAVGLFTGRHCELDVDECVALPNPCTNGGQCVNTNGSYICRCPSGFEGKQCENRTGDICTKVKHPCWNGGRCLSNPKQGSYLCECLPGFFGAFCQNEVNECASDPCMHGGTCVDLINAFQCRCPRGYTGARCETNVNDCSPNSCLNGGICHDELNGYSCSCPHGITGRHCEQCDSCLHNGTCHPKPGQNPPYECRCQSGYRGARCEVPPDWCQLLGQPCGDRGRCETVTGHGDRRFRCWCREGWRGDRCEIGVSHNCANFAIAANLSLVCRNGGECIDMPDHQFKCRCLAGYVGTFCEADEDDCASQPCLNGAVCRDGRRVYKCNCLPGYQGTNCEFDIDECRSKPCQHGGTCVDVVNGYRCICPAGTSGRNCEINEDDCAAKPCANGGECVDRVGAFHCSCRPGFTGSRCEASVNTCRRPTAAVGRQALGLCAPLGSVECVPRSGGNFTCICKEGFTGQFCQNRVDYCAESRRKGQPPCQNGGACVNAPSAPNGYMCECRPGFGGRFCELFQPACERSPCRHGGKCQPQPLPGPIYRCDCPPGLGGLHCEVDLVNECDSNPCLNGGTCLDSYGGFLCSCAPNYCGLQCQLSGALCPIWANCSAVRDGTVACHDVFADGNCDPLCNNKACLFDGWDCHQRRAEDARCPQDAECRRKFGDGSCHPECNSPGCHYDGGDCLSSPSPGVLNGDLASGFIVLIVNATVSDFKARWQQALLYSLSSLLRTTVRVGREPDGRLMIYPVPEKHRQKREVGSEDQPRTKVYLEIDNTMCHAAGGSCFETASSAAQFVSASLRSHTYQPPLSILDVQSEGPKSKPVVLPPTAMYTILAVVCFAVIAVLIGVLHSTVRKSKVRRAKIWHPDGSNSHNLHQVQQPPLPPHLLDVDTSSGTSAVSSCGAVTDSTGLLTEHWQPSTAVSGQPPNKRTKLEPVSPDAACDDNTQLLNCDRLFLASAATIRSTSGVGDLDQSMEGDRNREQILSRILQTAASSVPGCTLQDVLLNRQRLPDTGETLLHLAARYNRSECARNYINAGAGVNERDLGGRTPLMTAIDAGALETVVVLLEQPATDLGAVANDGSCPLIQAAKAGDLPILTQLLLRLSQREIHESELNRGDLEGRTALHWAAATNQTDLVHLLLAHGVNRDAQTVREETALYLAAKEGWLDTCRLLLENGANPDIAEHSDNTPKQVAARAGYADVVGLFDAYSRRHQSAAQHQHQHPHTMVPQPLVHNPHLTPHTCRRKQPTVTTSSDFGVATNPLTPLLHQKWQCYPPAPCSVSQVTPAYQPPPSTDSESPGQWTSSPDSSGGSRQTTGAASNIHLWAPLPNNSYYGAGSYHQMHRPPPVPPHQTGVPSLLFKHEPRVII